MDLVCVTGSSLFVLGSNQENCGGILLTDCCSTVDRNIFIEKLFQTPKCFPSHLKSENECEVATFVSFYGVKFLDVLGAVVNLLLASTSLGRSSIE